MNEMLIVGAILAAAWIGIMYMRVPSSIAFLSLLIGQLLSAEASGNVNGFVRSLFNIPDERYIEALLLILPLLLTIGFLRNRVPSSKVMIEAVPLLLIVSLAILLVAPLIQPLDNLVDAATNDQADSYKSIVVVAASVSGLLSAWMSYPRAGGKAHGKRKH